LIKRPDIVNIFRMPILFSQSCLIAACIFAFAVPACTPIADGMLTRVEAHVAHDQMMFVRQEPPTFGYQRLLTGMRDYPDLATFVNQRGLPDFLAETGDRSQRYMILYYLSRRQAFACRTISSRSRAVEFAGPYPITDGEFKTLDGIRQRATAAGR
jgi:hypothetical protein